MAALCFLPVVCVLLYLPWEESYSEIVYSQAQTQEIAHSLEQKSVLETELLMLLMVCSLW